MISVRKQIGMCIRASRANQASHSNRDAVSRTLSVFDLWENRFRQVKLDSLREAVDCPTCNGREFPWLRGERGSHSAALCGRNSVQLSFPGRERVDLAILQKQLEGVGKVSCNKFLLRLAVDEFLITVFPDGRAIIGGTDDIAEARTLYAKYVGN